MKFEYAGIEVTYDENQDVWEFQLRGRHRKAPTPAKAKEFIAKDTASNKAKLFPRFRAYRLESYQVKPDMVEVTSLDDDPLCCWVVNTDGTRNKRGLSEIVEFSDESRDIFKTIADTCLQRETLDKEILKLRKSLKRVEIPAEFR